MFACDAKVTMATVKTYKISTGVVLAMCPLSYQFPSGCAMCSEYKIVLSKSSSNRVVGNTKASVSYSK